MGVKCGRCKGKHSSADEVRACYNTALPKRTAPPANLTQVRGSITGPQEAYISGLLEELGRTEEDLKLGRPLLSLDWPEASGVIERLKQEAQERRNAERQKGKEEQTQRRIQPTIGGSVPAEGTYTVVKPGGDYRTIRFHTPTMGKYAGRMLVEYLAGPDNTLDFQRMGEVVPGGVRIWERYKGALDVSDAVAFLLSADQKQLGDAGYEYALKSSRCCRCGRVLTVEASINRGMGPDCAGKVA
jgi:hypothetical protein